jgi:putative hydrolase of the HAD superfamily
MYQQHKQLILQYPPLNAVLWIPGLYMRISLLADYPHETVKIAQWYYDEWLSNIPGLTVEKVAEKISNSNNRSELPLILLGHKRGELVGVVELKNNENKNYPEYEHWLGGLYVKPDYRGEGLSHALIEEAKKRADQLGIKKLYLQCESDNIELYERHNFLSLHNATHSGIPVTIMLWSNDI